MALYSFSAEKTDKALFCGFNPINLIVNARLFSSQLYHSVCVLLSYDISVSYNATFKRLS